MGDSEGMISGEKGISEVFYFGATLEHLGKEKSILFYRQEFRKKKASERN